MDVLIIYQFCTFGGVERVVLNRAKAFKKFNRDVNISVGYLHDIGALGSFQAYIQTHQLGDRLKAFLVDEQSLSKLDHYDYVMIIDTPQVMDQITKADNITIECHTPYIENRQYLHELPDNIRKIIVPSASFRATILKEFPDLPPVFVLPNPVPDEFFESSVIFDEKIFSKRPLTYFGRRDDLKNFAEALRIFELFNNEEDIMLIVIGGGSGHPNFYQSVAHIQMLGKALLRDRIDFDKAPYLINLVKEHRGIFISPSKGESFGLSAAEFMCGGVPVILSDIPEHRALVDDDQRFIYPLGDLSTAHERMQAILQHWDAYSVDISNLAQKFKGNTFLPAWDHFVSN
jgi:glycosyltransferase involved in cell wall biosynthesis